MNIQAYIKGYIIKQAIGESVQTGAKTAQVTNKAPAAVQQPITRKPSKNNTGEGFSAVNINMLPKSLSNLNKNLNKGIKI